MTKTLGTHNYYVYILTNKYKSVLYTGVTNDLSRRLDEHLNGIVTEKDSFTAKYKVHNLVYFERFQFINDAIKREKEIKGWTRIKKIKLISEFNPDWEFLNDKI